MLVLRSIRPRRVTRGSFSSLKSGHETELRWRSDSLSASALGTMVRNLAIWKRRPSLPDRDWRNRTGAPGHSSLTASATTTRSGASRIRAVAETAMSIARFTTAYARLGGPNVVIPSRPGSLGQSAQFGLLKTKPGPVRAWGKIPRIQRGSFLPCRGALLGQDPSINLTGVPGGSSVPLRGFCFITLLPCLFFTLTLQPAARSFLAAFLTVLPVTFGTMQLETMVALKPSSRAALVLGVLGAVSSVSGGTYASKAAPGVASLVPREELAESEARPMLSPALMGSPEVKVTMPGPSVPLCADPVLTNPPPDG